MPQAEPLRVVLSGGGTGGHIFPAIAIANAIKVKVPHAEINFVGAKGRMEMEKVPAAGYPIEGLWISGLQRRLTYKNLSFPFKVISSLWQAYQMLSKWKPDVVIGTGGYASGPTLRAAIWLGLPTLIQEQNSYPGITNKMLAPKVSRICVAYEGMEKYFPKSKISITGNPVRAQIEHISHSREEAARHFGLDPQKPILLVVGGSLGARTINESIEAGLVKLVENRIQLIWQTGKPYASMAAKRIKELAASGLITQAFITEMDQAYAAADLVISRAGAIAISEICITAKACILVPSPNVAEDHQTKNAKALVARNAAVMVSDPQASDSLVHRAIELIEQPSALASLSASVRQLAYPQAANHIAEIALQLAKKQVS